MWTRRSEEKSPPLRHPGRPACSQTPCSLARLRGPHSENIGLSDLKKLSETSVWKIFRLQKNYLSIDGIIQQWPQRGSQATYASFAYLVWLPKNPEIGIVNSCKLLVIAAAMTLHTIGNGEWPDHVS